MPSFRTRRSRIMLALGLVLLLALTLTPQARAVEFDDDGIVAADEVIDDDLFISGYTVVIDGTVEGDLFASGELITINGTVNGNLVAAGAKVTVNGTVDGSLVLAGQEILVNGPVGGSIYSACSSLELGPEAEINHNAIVAAFELRTQEGSLVGRDVLLTGYQAILEGRVDRDVQVDLGAIEIRGSIGGDVTAKVSQPGEAEFPAPFWPGMPAMIPSGLRVAEEAEIEGRLTYVSPIEQEEAIHSQPEDGVVYEPSATTEPAAEVRIEVQLGQWFLGRLQELVTLLVLGGLAVWQLPELLGRLADRLQARPLPATGWGLLVLPAGYLGLSALAVLLFVVWVLISLVTLGGLARILMAVGASGLGLAFAIFSLLALFGSKLVVAFLGGRALLREIAPTQAGSPAWAMVIGVTLYVILRGIPCLGWVLLALTVLAGLGAMWFVFREGWR